MTGIVCLQGGGEFGDRCRDLDAELLRRAGAGPVVVVPLASAPGREWRAAGDNGRRYLRALGAPDVVVPDDPADAVAAIRTSALTFLPGGSPGRLLDAVADAELAAAIREVPHREGVLAGASAGAMVLCGHTLLPDRRGPDGVPVVPGLGVVPDALVVPHHSGSAARLEAAASRLPEGVTVLGLPECGGVVVDADGAWTAWGAVSVLVHGAQRRLQSGGVISAAERRERG